jgi:hypothetical protein
VVGAGRFRATREHAEALGPTVAAVLRQSCPVGRRRGLAWPHARRRAWVRADTVPISSGSVPTQFSPIFPTKVSRVINSKVVDLLFLYNFRKRHRVFFSTICAQFGCQDAEILGSSEQCLQALTFIFHTFPLRISNATQHESCVP